MSIGIGDALRQAREAQGRSQQDAAQSLRVRSDYVEALETEQFGIFGADTYARGHLRNYANLLGLDAQPLMDLYDQYVRTDDQTAHHFADAPVAMTTREPLPKWVTWIAGTIVVLIAIAMVGLFGSRAPDPADLGIADGTGATEPSPTETDRQTDPEPEPEPEPEPTFDGVEMFLIVEADCWVRILVDGQPHPRSETVLRAGDTLNLQGEEVVTIRYGDAGGVLVEVNGESYGRPGGNGQVIEVSYGPDGPQESADSA